MTFFFKVASINYFSVMNKLYLFLIAFYIFAPGEDKASHLVEAEAICKSFFKF